MQKNVNVKEEKKLKKSKTAKTLAKEKGIIKNRRNNMFVLYLYNDTG